MYRRLLELRWRLFARHLAASKAPILCGPWRSEVGFEVLYWLPFLHAFRETYHIDLNRLIAIGRGGSAAWYQMAGAGDLYEHMPLEAVRALSVQASQQTGSMKQYDTPAWERHACALAATSIGLKHYHVLSPSWMYSLLAPWWNGQEPISFLDQHLLHLAQMPAPKLAPEIAKHLPPQFMAMRWYARPTWPLSEPLLLWQRKFVEAVARQIPVVLITSGMHTDDHADMSVGTIPNVLNLKDFAPQTEKNNLAIQSAVIAKAQGYVGTYGGMSQLAMRLGVPTLALYEQFGQTAPAHLALTQSLSLKSGVPFVATTPRDVEALMPLLAKSGQKMAPVHQPDTELAALSRRLTEETVTV